VLHPVAIHFKGSGFYSTDYGRGKKAGATDGKAESSSSSSSSDGKSASSEKSSGSGGGGDSKPAKAAEA
jgi:predicted nucleic acid-binding Zn ribbon protein